MTTKAPKTATTVQLPAIRISNEMNVEILEEIASCSPAMRAKLMATGVNPDVQPMKAFMLYAMAMARGKLTAEPPARAFGSKIDEFVDSIMSKNRAFYEEYPADWWRLTAIGSSMLRDAGHNPVSIKRWIEENSARIAAHHAEVGIDDPANHNRKAGKARKQYE